MKKIIIILTITLAMCCKKKQEPLPEPEPTPAAQPSFCLVDSKKIALECFNDQNLAIKRVMQYRDSGITVTTKTVTSCSVCF
jgi:hypothetical protein